MLERLFVHRYLLSSRSEAVVRIISRICIVGIGIGVLSLIVVVGIMNGFNDTIHARLLAVEPHLVVTGQDLDVVQNVVGVSGQSHLLDSQDVLVRTAEGLFSGAIAQGLTENSLTKMLNLLRDNEKMLSRQEFLDDFEIGEPLNLNANEIIMGIDLARSLGVLEGDEVLIVPPESLLLPAGEIPVFEKVRVRKFLSSRVAEIDSQFVYYVRGHSLNRLNHTLSRQTSIEVRLYETQRYEELAKLLRQKGLEVQTWAERNSALFYSLRMEKITMAVFLALGTLIACFAIVTVLVLLINQKRKEIGILVALGMSPRQVSRIFYFIGLSLSLLGMGGGLILGLAVCFYLIRFPVHLMPDFYYESRVPATINVWFVVTVTLGCFLVAWLATFFSTRSLVKYSSSSADALRPRH